MPGYTRYNPRTNRSDLNVKILTRPDAIEASQLTNKQSPDSIICFQNILEVFCLDYLKLKIMMKRKTTLQTIYPYLISIYPGKVLENFVP